MELRIWVLPEGKGRSMSENKQIRNKCIVTGTECDMYTHYMCGDVDYNYHWCEAKDNSITKDSTCPKDGSHN
jgi:hypothetical protein